MAFCLLVARCGPRATEARRWDLKDNEYPTYNRDYPAYMASRMRYAILTYAYNRR